MELASDWIVARLEDGWLNWSTMLGACPSGDDESLEALRIASGYYYIEGGTEDREEWGPYGPAVVLSNGMSAPLLEDVEPKILEMWGRIIDEVDHPSVTARLADLLWLRRFGEPAYVRAEQAIAALIECSDEPSYDGLERVVSLDRAAELARQLGRPEAANQIADSALAFATEFLDASDFKPGLFFRAIDILVEMAAHASDVADLLNQVVERGDVDAWTRESGRELLLRLPTSARVDHDAVVGALIADWVHLARNSEPSLHLDHLHHARRLAERYNRADLADDIDLLIQQAPPPALEAIRAEFDIPPEVIEALREHFGEPSRWADVLDALAAMPILPGTFRDAQAFQEKLRNEHPLNFLFQTQVIKGENHVVWTATTPEEILDYRTHQYEASNATTSAFLVYEVWRQLDMHKSLDPADLTGIEAGRIDERAARAVGRSIAYWIDGDVEGACCGILPHLERVIRKICIDLGIVVYIPQRGAKPGQMRTFGTLLTRLQEIAESAHTPEFDAILVQLANAERTLNGAPAGATSGSTRSRRAAK